MPLIGALLGGVVSGWLGAEARSALSAPGDPHALRSQPDDISPEGVGRWYPLNMFARQCFGASRAQKEIASPDRMDHQCRMSGERSALIHGVSMHTRQSRLTHVTTVLDDTAEEKSGRGCARRHAQAAIQGQRPGASRAKLPQAVLDTSPSSSSS